MTRRTDWRDWISDGMTALSLMVVFNANGHEIGHIDSQPTKSSARELLGRGT